MNRYIYIVIILLLSCNKTENCSLQDPIIEVNEETYYEELSEVDLVELDRRSYMYGKWEISQHLDIATINDSINDTINVASDFFFILDLYEDGTGLMTMITNETFKVNWAFDYYSDSTDRFAFFFENTLPQPSYFRPVVGIYKPIEFETNSQKWERRTPHDYIPDSFYLNVLKMEKI